MCAYICGMCACRCMCLCMCVCVFYVYHVSGKVCVCVNVGSTPGSDLVEGTTAKARQEERK